MLELDNDEEGKVSANSSSDVSFDVDADALVASTWRYELCGRCMRRYEVVCF